MNHSLGRLEKNNAVTEKYNNIICVCAQSLSRVWLFTTSWTTAWRAPLSMGNSRQEYWSELLFPSPGDLPDPGIKPGSPALQQLLYCLNHQGSPFHYIIYNILVFIAIDSSAAPYLSTWHFIRSAHSETEQDPIVLALLPLSSACLLPVENIS